MDYLQRLAAMEQIRKLIAYARTWPAFIDHEAEITALLQNHPEMSLTEAYTKATGLPIEARHPTAAPVDDNDGLYASYAEAMVQRIETVGYLHR